MRMASMSTSRGAGLSAVVLAMVGFSWGFVIVKAVNMPTQVMAFWRVMIGAVVLGLFALAFRVRWPRVRGALVVAGIAFGVHQLIFMAAVKETSIAIVTIIAALQPLLVAMVSQRAVGEVVPKRVYGCIVLAVIGVAVVVLANYGDSSRSLFGDILAIINVVVFSVYFLATKRARMDGAPALTLTAGVLTVAAFVVAPAAWWVGYQLPTHVQWGFLAILALGSGNGHLLMNWAHSRVPAVLASLASAIVPVLASIWAALIFDEPYTWLHVVGMVLVVGAIEVGRRAASGVQVTAASAAGPTTITKQA